MHKKNLHNQNYDFEALIRVDPDLKKYVIKSKNNLPTINFAIPNAIKELNRALLMKYYDIKYWDIPPEYLCPPIPGRAEYIHQVADLLDSINYKSAKKNINCLDIGVGANCIYPIVGAKLYNWNFVGTDVDDTALRSAQRIIDSNDWLKPKVNLRKQKHRHLMFETTVKAQDKFDISICNPPFFKSRQDAQEASVRKNRNLHASKSSKPKLNFQGKSHELWCSGGERKFILRMIEESPKFAQQVKWFTTLVASNHHLNGLKARIKEFPNAKHRVIDISLGNKKSRILAWTFK